jgi:UDPglucose--hexose-1-phosphate uridylyltransferase
MDTSKNKSTELRFDPIFGEWVMVSDSHNYQSEGLHMDNQLQELDTLSHWNSFSQKKICSTDEILDTISTPSGEVMVNVVPYTQNLPFSFERLNPHTYGPYHIISSQAVHELFVYQEKDLELWDFSVRRTEYMFEAFQKRAMRAMKYKSIKANCIFHHHDATAHRGLQYTYSQFVAMPVIPPDLDTVVSNASQYHQHHKRHLFEVIQEFEEEQAHRIIYRNDDFIVFVPFGSHYAFEMMILPREHAPHFEYMTKDKRLSVARAFIKAMQALKNALRKPSYSFFIYSAPVDGQEHRSMRWFIRIIPNFQHKTPEELAGVLSCCKVTPEDAAIIYRKMIG